MSNALKRQPIKKSVRFEVLKRDSFTCQYCGGKAPDIVLHIDHIKPVAAGGGNDIMNLITSCQPCNLGKGVRRIDDRSAIEKQSAQLEELSQRHEQLSMMMEWRDSLGDFTKAQIEAFSDALKAPTGRGLSDNGRASVKKWLAKNDMTVILAALDSALETTDDAEKVMKLIPRILGAQKKYADRPHMKDLFYIRAIVRNRMFCKDHIAIALLEEAYSMGAHVEELKTLAATAKNWTEWKVEMSDWIEELKEAA